MKSAVHTEPSNPTSSDASSVRIKASAPSNGDGRPHASGEYPGGHHAAAERETVRPRAPSSPDVTGRSVPRAPTRAPSSPELALSREQRLELKLLEAEALLERSDPRRRLLQAAAMRSDEGLVDAVLSTLRDDDRDG